ncbi:MAG TPA: hypothetical protein VK820_11705 [Steroidobacteraceae bacterium]|jgi:hypothetical protein|nr:hypothetical protein [Steroidobacteraceae bacterium]
MNPGERAPEPAFREITSCAARHGGWQAPAAHSFSAAPCSQAAARPPRMGCSQVLIPRASTGAKLMPRRDGAATVVTYRAHVVPRIFVPRRLALDSLTRDLPALLQALRTRCEAP